MLELVVQGESTRYGPVLCSVAKARRDLHQGCSGYVTYIMVTRKKGMTTVDDVPIMRDYPNVFSEYFPGVPPDRQVKFQIHLVPGAALIAEAPYRLAPPVMQELSTRLQELLDMGFI